MQDLPYDEVLAIRVTPTVVLNQITRTELERLSRKRSLAARDVVRRRIVLLAADGLQNQQIAVELGVSMRMAALRPRAF